MHQVITIGPDGSVSGLQRKPGQGLDLRQFGKADIKRASLIEWDAAEQAWFVNVVQEAGKGPLTTTKWREAGLPGAPDFARDDIMLPGSTYHFDEYDDAVVSEIKYLDALRLSGQF